MTPADQAAELCRARGGNFREELEAHLLHGYVFSGPEIFAMFRAVPRSTDVANLWTPWPREECDAWFVWAGVGNPAELLALMPFPLPWVGWHRQGRGWQDCHWWATIALRERFESALAPQRFNCYSDASHGRIT